MHILQIKLAVSLGAVSVGALSCGAVKRAATTPARPKTHFAVLDLPPTSDDTLPPEMVAAFRAEDDPGINAGTRTRRVLAGSNPGWLVLTPTKKLCLARRTYPLRPVVNGLPLPPISSKTCTSEEAAVSGRLVETESLVTQVGERARNIVVGVVPDGVAMVTIREGDGAIVIGHVTRNAYEALTTHPRSVEFASRGRRYVVQVRSFSGGHYMPPKVQGGWQP